MDDHSETNIINTEADTAEYAPSERYFENRACPYYPCHKRAEAAEGKDVHINCLFCYCPMYHLENCLGNPTYKEKNGRRIKVCTNCTFPHEKDNYELVMKKIRGES
ncbi:MAG: metal-binding protein [Eubacterium sp.]|nr:metal-binding protein [Eubacterium sp.]